MTDKIQPHHLARKVILYVRQSSSHQVLHNEESRRLQYAMEARLRTYGWQEVEIIDDDLGRSGTSTLGRVGFQHLVAEVCLGKVGAVAAREVSRFARNNRDWHQLIEMCRVVDTLLIDHEAVYEPRSGSDRLLLGLKGSMSEYELDLLRQRSLEARRQMAARGDLIVLAPVGYLKTPNQKLDKDPDRRVQKIIALAFEKFLELSTVRQTLMWFIEQGLELPARRFGVLGWETHWKRPSYRTVLAILRNPTYAGAYAYGKTCARAHVRDGALVAGRARKPLEEWSVLLRDRHEGYISWETFDRIQTMIDRNSHDWKTPGTGAAKGGPALLTGLLRCRRCGRVLMVHYTGVEHNVLRYHCRRGHLDQGEPRCINFGGSRIDELVGKEVLRVVEPAALEAAVCAATATRGKQEGLVEALRLELRAARYEVDRARKQFDGVDPDNRLVADELEHRWNRALVTLEEVKSRLQQEEDRLRENRPPAARDHLRDLTEDLVRAWQAPETDVRLKKRIVRTLIEEIVVDVNPNANEVVLVIHWKGGVHSELRVGRRRTGENRLHTTEDIVEAVRLLARVCTDEIIAGVLNRNGLRTGRGNRWTKERVVALRSHQKIPKHTLDGQRKDGWMKLGEASAHLGVAAKTLRRAVEQGVLRAQRPLPIGPWIFAKNDLDSPAVRQRVDEIHAGLRRDGTGPTSKQLSLRIPTT